MVVGVLASVGIPVVTTVAAIDHAHKVHSLQRANVSDWFCSHQGSECDSRKPDDVEDAWSARERVYKGMDVGLLVVAVAAVIAVNRSRE